ncbi:MAG: signal recognition particle protein, partial [Hyphomicrobiales bacterium]
PAEKMRKGQFDLQDLSDQLGQMQKMGGMGGLMGMMPGIGKMKKQIAASGIDDSIFKRQQAIISSMTRKERSNPKLLNANRKKRVASGSGTNVQDINKLLKMHRQMADMMKSMGKKKGGLMGALGGMMGGGGGMPGGMPPGAGGMPDMDPKQLEKMAKQMGVGAPGGLPGTGLPGLGGPGGLPGLPGLGKGKK